MLQFPASIKEMARHRFSKGGEIMTSDPNSLASDAVESFQAQLDGEL